MDTTDPQITFDAAGNCVHCTQALRRLSRRAQSSRQKAESLEKLVNIIKREGKGRDYDCVIGLSGGVDSTAVAYNAKKLELRPLGVHFDNGWDSELAVDNIKKTLDKLKIDLATRVVDWDEFRDLQMSFLRASVANCEIPTDHGITATLFHYAVQVNTRFILSGSNLATESIMPISWGHYNQDLKHLLAVHQRFGTVPIKTLPTLSISDYLYQVLVRRTRQVPFLNYIDYDKERYKAVLAREIGWRDYGGKHYESVWTRFFQGYYLPQKFGFDKRRAHYSSLICSGGMTRDQALAQMELPVYPEELLHVDTQFVCKKFELTKESFDELMKLPAQSHLQFPSHYFLFHRLRRMKNVFRAIATRP